MHELASVRAKRSTEAAPVCRDWGSASRSWGLEVSTERLINVPTRDSLSDQLLDGRTDSNDTALIELLTEETHTGFLSPFCMACSEREITGQL